MISYVHDPATSPEWGGLYCPVIVCDACAKPITEHGNVYWLVLDAGQIHPQLWHTHKGRCGGLDDVIRRTHGGGLVMWEELHVWLEQLTNNYARLPDCAMEER